MTSDDVEAVLAAGHLFDDPPSRAWTEGFLAGERNHLLIAYVDEEPAGFVSGIETHHPDKPPEMLLYELGVAAAHRRRGIGASLTAALRDLARDRDLHVMWVVIDAGDEVPAATYAAAGATARDQAEILTWDLRAPR